MKCWECKKEVFCAIRVPYLTETEEKYRDVCSNCFERLPRNSCGFVVVSSLRERVLI